MERIDFTKGINTREEPINTPAGSYRDAENMRPSGVGLKSLEGTEDLFRVYGPVYGSCDVGEDTYLIVQNEGVAVVKVDRDGNKHVPFWEDVQWFSGEEEVQVEGRKNWAGEVILYFSTQGHGARRLNVTEGYYDGVSTSDFLTATSLFLEYELPKVNYVEETTGGDLLSGSYQVFARLVTETGASTPFGPNAGVYPITTSNYKGETHSISGDPVDTVTNKAIKVEIENVDTTFKYLQLGVLTYVGLDNQPVATISNLIVIGDSNVVDATYRGTDDILDTISVSELISTGVAYNGGEFLAQKDGTLLISGPTTKEVPDVDWNQIAVRASLTWTTKFLRMREALTFSGGSYGTQASNVNALFVETSSTVDPDLNGYGDPVNCALYKGYRRGEAYALQLTPVFTGGVHGPTVHIPGNHSVNTPAKSDRTLGTKITEAKYPDNRYAPTIVAGQNVRHHLMPDLLTAPIITHSGENAIIYALGLNINLHLTSSEKAVLGDALEGIIISRGDRRSDPTQLAQGYLRRNTVYVKPNDPPSAGEQTILPGCGRMSWIQDSINTGASGNYYEGTPTPDSGTFLAPDIIHNTTNAADADYIQLVTKYYSYPYRMKGAYIVGNVVNSGNDPNRRNMHFINTEGSIPEGSSNPQPGGTNKRLTRILAAVEVQPTGVPGHGNDYGGSRNTTVTSGSDSLVFASTQGFSWLRFDGDVEYPDLEGGSTTDWRLSHLFQASGTSGNEYSAFEYKKGGHNGSGPEAAGTRVDFLLHSLIRSSPKQYGEIDQMVGMFAHYQPWSPGALDSFNFYGGDTFISKYGLAACDEAKQMYGTGNGDKEDGHNCFRPPGNDTMIYFWLESDNNYNYRHYLSEGVFSTDPDGQGEDRSLPYYPKYKRIADTEGLGLLTLSGKNFKFPGHANLYNTQYSTQPTVFPFVNTPIEDITKEPSYKNRVIYSDVSVQGEKTDSYQVFLPNNYYDVPQEYGDLTDLYVNRELFASTAQVQWRLFFNTLATQATSVGEVVLGTGGAFNRPAVPMATVDGGFGGTAHWLHAKNTPWGRVFVDRDQGKIFIQQDNLKPISSTLSDNLQLKIRNMDITKIAVASEPLREHALIVLDEDIWAFDIGRWAFYSRHTYRQAKNYFTHGAHLYSVIHPTGLPSHVREIHRHSTGRWAEFYGEQLDSSVTLSVNMGNSTSKLFRTIEVKTDRYLYPGVTPVGDIMRKATNETFNKIEVWNEERWSGEVKITPDAKVFQTALPLEVFTRRVKDGFRMSIPRDIVISPDFYPSNRAYENIKIHPGDTTNTDWLARMRGNYIEVKLTATADTFLGNHGEIKLFDVSLDVSENIR